LSKVDLPLPDAPSRQTNSPALRSRSTPCKATTSSSPVWYTLRNWRASKTTPAAGGSTGYVELVTDTQANSTHHNHNPHVARTTDRDHFTVARAPRLAPLSNQLLTIVSDRRLRWRRVCERSVFPKVRARVKRHWEQVSRHGMPCRQRSRERAHFPQPSRPWAPK